MLMFPTSFSLAYVGAKITAAIMQWRTYDFLFPNHWYNIDLVACHWSIPVSACVLAFLDYNILVDISSG